MRFEIGVEDRSVGYIDVVLVLEAGDRHGVDRDPGEGLALTLPVWTPGSYLVREYARQLGPVRLLDADGGRGVRLSKTAKNRWLVPPEALDVDAPLRVGYRVYARELTVRTAFASDDFVFWDGATLYLWPETMRQCAAEVVVTLPAGWRLAAGGRLPEVDAAGAARFGVAGQDEAVDTPCLAGAWRRWDFDVHGVPHRLAAVGLGALEPPPAFAADLQRVVASTAAVFGGELPLAEYTFQALFGAAGRGGLEHRDSSVLLAPRTTFQRRAEYEDFLGLVAHEYLHVWNVKRMRPRCFTAYDYDAETYTQLLWVAEGFTAYYDELCCRRAGVMSVSHYLGYLGRDLRNILDNPGRFEQSLAEASYDAWIRLYRADENTRNSTQNYYGNGAVVAFWLDAEIRRVTAGARSLDDALRRLYGRTVAERDAAAGYTEDDVVEALSWAAGQDFAGRVAAAVHGTPPQVDIEAALALYGLRYGAGEHAGVPYFGVQIPEGSTVLAAVRADSPAARAGLRAGDEVLAFGAHRVTAADWRMLWDALAREGEELALLTARDGLLVERRVRAGACQHLPSAIESVARPSESQLAHREAWLGTRALG